MEDTTLIWFWVLSVLVMNYKWQQGKWRTPVVTVCQPRWLCIHFWVGNLFSSIHCTPLSTTPPFCLLSLCFHFPAGDWKAGGRAAPWADLWKQKGKAQAKKGNISYRMMSLLSSRLRLSPSMKKSLGRLGQGLLTHGSSIILAFLVVIHLLLQSSHLSQMCCYKTCLLSAWLKHVFLFWLPMTAR